MTDDFLIERPVYPTHPCICGHPITAHGEETQTYGRWEWDEDHKEEVEIGQDVSVPVCYECEGECYFVEMTNLEYLEWKSNGNDKR